MKTRFPAYLACLALALSFPVAAAGAAEGHDHHHDGAGEAGQLQLNAGKKWPTDAPLRQAMGDINQAMAKAVPLIHKERFDDKQYQATAATVRQKVAYAVEHCKLEPKADAMLHLVIADLMAGADAMEAGDAASRHAGAVRVLKALRDYGGHFHHPGWKAAGGAA